MLIKSHIDIHPAFLGNIVKRLLAFVIDIFPIIFLIMLVHMKFLGKEELFMNYFADPNNPDYSEPFTLLQKKINNIGLGVYIIYCFILESSTMQATVGKLIMGIKVIGSDGNRPTPKEALWRNISKIISSAVLNMGYIWILFDKQRRGWHDIIGKTIIVEKDYVENSDGLDVESIDYEEIKDKPYTNPALTLSESNFLSIYEGNQTNLLYPADINTVGFEKIIHSNSNAQTKLNIYKEILVDEVLINNENIPADVLWSNSTKGQKLFRTFITLDQHMEESGLFEFLFYNNEFSFALEELLDTIMAKDLKSFYNPIITSLKNNLDKFHKFLQIYDLSSGNISHQKEAMENAKNSIAGDESFNAYYYSNREELSAKICTYIESNRGLFFKL